MRRIEKIIEYGLYLLIFLLPVQARWIIRAGELNGGYSEYGTVSLYGTDILIIIILISFVFYKFLISNFKFLINVKCQMSPPKVNPCPSGRRAPLVGNVKLAWLFIVLLGLASFISIFFAPDKILAIYSYIKLLLGVGLFWLVINANYDRIKLLAIFL